MTDERDLVRRWSNRKQRARQANRTNTAADPGSSAFAADSAAVSEPDIATVQDPDEAHAVSTRQDDQSTKIGDAVAVEDLPDIETLDETSDFSAFLREGVPEELQRRALRKLWRTDPVLANLDGLVDYGEDFTDAALVVDNLKTAYKVGRGLVQDDEGPDEEQPSEGADSETIAEAEPQDQDNNKDALDQTESTETPEPESAPEAQDNPPVGQDRKPS